VPKGYHKNRTKSQNLREIVQSQSGFLGGLNLDNPKSDVGETQVTVLKNMLPFRDRIEARGGLKTALGLAPSGSDEGVVFNGAITTFYYDEDWESIFYQEGNGGLGIVNPDSKPIVNAEDYLPSFDEPTFTRVNDNVLISDDTHMAILEDRGADHFLRPLISSGGTPISPTPDLIAGTPGVMNYGFKYSFVRIVDGVVISESEAFTAIAKWTGAGELDGSATPFAVLSGSNNLPDEYYVAAGSNNFFTHIRYYRTTELSQQNFVSSIEGLESSNYYYVGDYELNSLSAAPVTTYLDLNITDTELLTKTIYWQDGYLPMPPSRIIEASSAMLLVRNSVRKNESVYCPLSTGDNQKYIGWYNPFFQYSAGVNGDITEIQDVGSYCLITTRKKSYYIDTVNKSEDPDQQLLAIYTPILSDVVLLDDTVGIEENQRLSLVKQKEGSLIGLTSDGAIRAFSGYTWGVDLAKNNVHSITKGNVLQNKLPCNSVFVNDAYYLFYTETDGENSFQNTLRMGTTEEAGYGFSIFTGEPETPYDFENATGWPYYANDNTGNNISALVIKDKLNVIRKQKPSIYSEDFNLLLEYTGDKFDHKINKDVVDAWVISGGLVWDSTTYYDVAEEIEFPEITGSSEAYFLYFLKSNFFLRKDKYAYKVTDENLRSYQITDDDLTNVTLDDIEFSLDARVDESDDIVASNEDFEPTSAVILQRDVQGHRIRITLRANAAGFQLTKMEARFKRHDRTELKPSKTTDNTAELNTGMYCLINQYLKNFAVGNSRASAFDIGIPIEGAFIGGSNEPQVIGTDASLITGPDGNQTGIALASDSDYEFQAPPLNTISTATIMFWYKNFNGRIVVGWDSSERNQYEFQNIADVWNVINNDITTVFTSDANESDWTHIAFIHDSDKWNVYKNGILDDSSTSLVLDSYINNMSIKMNGAVNIADLRMYNKNLTADQLLLYCKNVINNEGDYVNGY